MPTEADRDRISSVRDMAEVFSEGENRLQDGEEEILWPSMFVRILEALVGSVDLPTRSSDVYRRTRDNPDRAAAD